MPNRRAKAILVPLYRCPKLWSKRKQVRKPYIKNNQISTLGTTLLSAVNCGRSIFRTPREFTKSRTRFTDPIICMYASLNVLTGQLLDYEITNEINTYNIATTQCTKAKLKCAVLLEREWKATYLWTRLPTLTPDLDCIRLGRKETRISRELIAIQSELLIFTAFEVPTNVNVWSI